METLTVDPELFSNPKDAYLYVMENRCVSVTTQDLYRWGYLATRRYFYVIEWQKDTQMPHFHVLYDSKYISWNAILYSWGKHRPKDAGEVKENRPRFGTVLHSAPNFKDPAYAGRYATKYLIKTPKEGFPEWVLDMGKERRIRRYSASRGFWGETSSKSNNDNKDKRKNQQKSYRERINGCGQTVNFFQLLVTTDIKTGEVEQNRKWLGQLDIQSKNLIPKINDNGNPKRNRRIFCAENFNAALTQLSTISQKKLGIIRKYKTFHWREVDEQKATNY
ncbi:hypothetical protein [Sedimentisphaera salicampi]|nr:hypothetical protein [Sedimentisphaera salicampi]